MKQIMLLTIAIMLLAGRCHAQDKGYFGVLVGPSIPIGVYGSSLPQDASGFATTGVVVDLSFGYKFGQFLGICGQVRGMMHSFNTEAFTNELNMQTGVPWTAESNGWVMGGMFGGLYSSSPLSEKVSLDSRLMIGILNVASPNLDIEIAGSNGAAWVKQTGVSAATLAFLFGIGFRFNPGERISLLVNMDYMGASPGFRNVETTSSLGGAPETNSFTQSIGTLNFGFGAGFRL